MLVEVSSPAAGTAASSSVRAAQHGGSAQRSFILISLARGPNAEVSSAVRSYDPPLVGRQEHWQWLISLGVFQGIFWPSTPSRVAHPYHFLPHLIKKGSLCTNCVVSSLCLYIIFLKSGFYFFICEQTSKATSELPFAVRLCSDHVTTIFSSPVRPQYPFLCCLSFLLALVNVCQLPDLRLFEEVVGMWWESR